MHIFSLILGHFGEVKEDELPNEDCGDSGVFPVKDSNSNSNLSPKLDRINRFLNDVSAIQNADQTNMLQFRYVYTTTAEFFSSLNRIRLQVPTYRGLRCLEE